MNNFIEKANNIKMQLELFLSPLIDKYDRNPICKLMINVMPFGNIIDVFFSQAAADIKQSRLEYFFDKLILLTDNIIDIQKQINKLNAEEFYDLLRDIADLAVKSRMNEIRDIVSIMVRDAVSGEEKIYNIESLLQRIADLKEKDIAIIKYCYEYDKKYPSNQSDIIHSKLNARKLSAFINKEDFDIEECTWYLSRLANFGILFQSTVELQPTSVISYSTTKIFDKINKCWEH